MRRRVAKLAPHGRLEWDELDQRSDLIASRLLDGLDGAQRTELVTALRTADRLLRLTSISMAIVDSESPAARDAMRAYFAELDQRFPTGFDVGDGHDDELASMRAPTGGFVIVDDAGSAVGCGGLRRIDDFTAEIKRMWLHESLRGLGMGKRLLARLEQLAADLGYGIVVLDTNAVLTQAVSMYEGAGYESIERYNDNPYAQRWFRKQLC